MADPNPVPASVGTSTISTLAIPAAEVVVGVTERGRVLTVAEIRAELRQGSVRLPPTKGLVSVDPKGSVFARFERVTPGTYTAHAERVDGSGVMQATADPKTVVVTAPHTEVDLYLFVPELKVLVTDTSRPAKPIEGAQVGVSGPATLTGTSDASGAKTFKPLPLGDYTIKASDPRYEDGTGTATVTTTPSSVTLALKSRLNVHVVEKPETSAQGQKSITSAKVDLSGAQAASATSDGSGVAPFRGIVTGSYTIKATHPGYEDGTTTVVVPAENDTVTVELERIRLEIVEVIGEQRFVVREDEERTRVVGQLLVLAVRTHPLGHTLSEIQWTISGEYVKDYDPEKDKNIAVRQDVTGPDLRLEQLSFHWISGGVKDVRVTAKVDGEPCTVAWKVNVLAPTALDMASKLGEFSVGPASATSSSVWLQLVGATKRGIEWDFRAVQPVGGQGEFAGFQLVKVDNSVKLKSGAALQGTHQSTGGKFVLDKQAPYEAASKTSGNGAAIGQWTSGDSPGLELLPDLTEAHLNDDFEMYFMYKSVEEGSIWVTLGVLEWHCRATVTRTGPGNGANDWSAPTNQDPSHGPGQPMPKPVWKPSTTLPTWTANIESIPWK